MKQRIANYKQQQGIALIMVLLVVALVTIIAEGIRSNQELSTRRTENLLNNEQAYMYLLGAEDWAGEILIQDAKDNKTDSLDDKWAAELPAIPVRGGVIKGSIEDLQARFNINSIIDNAGNPNAANILLLQNLVEEINNQQSEVLIPTDIDQAITDWLDSNEEAIPPNGAEDGEYLNRPIPYVAANGLMANPSELIKVNGFNYNMYSEIAPYIVALPNRATLLNINTADAMQISSLSKQIILSQAKDIIKSRDKKGYKTLDEFLDDPKVKGRNIAKTLIGLKSDFFLLKARAIIGNSRAELYSILYRSIEANNKASVKVLLRSQRRI